MAKDISQAEPAHLYIPTQQERDAPEPALVLSGLSKRLFGPKPVDVEAPFPAVTHDLVDKVILVSRALQHAREHGNLKGAGELIKINDEYRRIIREQIDNIGKKDRSAYWLASGIYNNQPATRAQFERALQLEFSLAGAGNSTIAKFFHTRNNLSDRYIWTNRKDEGLAPLLVKT